MRKRLHYLNSIHELVVSNSKEEVRFFKMNRRLTTPYAIYNLVGKDFDGLVIKKEGIDIKEKLDEIIKELEPHFVLSFQEFNRLTDLLKVYEEKNIKVKFEIREDELVAYINKKKEPNELKKLNRYFSRRNEKRPSDTLMTKYVDSDKFIIRPLWDKKTNTIEDYLNYFKESLIVLS